MRFSTAPSPHIASSASVSRLMVMVLIALIPGLFVQVLNFGPGVLIQLVLALIAGLSAEAAMLYWRRRPIAPLLLDGSAAVTAVLLALALPPIVPWWMTVFGTLFAIVIGKQIYGGLGYNPFNPAMVGYAVLLISFPRHMTAWLPPMDLSPVSLELADLWGLVFRNELAPAIDAIAMATPLDTMKTGLGMGRALDEIQSGALFGAMGGKGWQWVNLGYLLGGLWLIRREVIGWQIPVAYLGALFLMSMMFFMADPGAYPTPLFHLLSGATMLGAFFIATDPVSASTTPKGRLIYGALIGVLVFVIRSWGGYPDGVAFAVLLMNLAAPTIDHFTRPRVYGHSS
jgi:electron transport complex protein RnfD